MIYKVMIVWVWIIVFSFLGIIIVSYLNVRFFYRCFDCLLYILFFLTIFSFCFREFDVKLKNLIFRVFVVKSDYIISVVKDV